MSVKEFNKFKTIILTTYYDSFSYYEKIWKGKFGGSPVKIVERAQILSNDITSILEPLLTKLDKNRLFSHSILEDLWEKDPVHRCGICNTFISEIIFATVDHKEEWVLGGKTGIENARLVHRSCNQSEGATSSRKQYSDARSHLTMYFNK